MLIHISGPSGSGKTTMLLEIQTWSAENAYAVGIRDVDDMTPEIYRELNDTNQMNVAAGGRLFMTLLQAAIQKERDKHDILVVCGLIDTVIAGKSYCAKINADHTFYIKIADNVLLSQYLARIAHVINNKPYHDRLLCGDTSLLFDRRILLQWKQDTEKLYHKRLRYKLMPYADILSAIKATVVKHRADAIISATI